MGGQGAPAAVGAALFFSTTARSSFNDQPDTAAFRLGELSWPFA